MIPTTLLRARLFVDEHDRELVRALLALAVLAAVGAAWVAATPETTRATERTDVQTVGADVHTGALVTTNDSVWERGTTLENRSTYFADVSPRLQLRAVTSVPEGQPVAVNESLTLTIAASRDGETFYTERRVLHRANRTVTDGRAAANATLDVPRIRERLNALQAEFGSVADLSTTVEYRVRYDTGDYRGTVTGRAPLVVDGNAYWLAGSLADEREHSRTQTSVTESTNASLLLGLAGVALLGFGGAAGVWVYARREVDRDELLLELHSRQMSEWISDGEVPIFLDAEFVRLESLRDVVDIGIDNEKRVIHDERRNIYAVLDDDVAYYYSPDTSWRELPRFDTEGERPPGVGGETPVPQGEEDFGFGEFDAEFGDDE